MFVNVKFDVMVDETADRYSQQFSQFDAKNRNLG